MSPKPPTPTQALAGKATSPSPQVLKMAKHWISEPSHFRLLGQRENTVYSVCADKQDPIVLRFLRPRYNTYRQLQSEVLWLNDLHQRQVSIPEPVRSRRGRYLHSFKDGGQLHYVNASRFLAGQPLKTVLPTLTSAERQQLLAQMGQAIAHLHRACDAFVLPEEFSRRHWSTTQLIGRSPAWGQFCPNPLLDKAQEKLVRTAIVLARKDMRQFALQKPDYGLIHADLNTDNIFCQAEQGDWTFSWIDFDDGGFGFRAYDLAICLLALRSDDASVAERQALLHGYQEIRTGAAEDATTLGTLLTMIRALTLLGWVAERLDDCTDPLRPQRAVTRALTLVHEYLAQH